MTGALFMAWAYIQDYCQASSTKLVIAFRMTLCLAMLYRP